MVGSGYGLRRSLNRKTAIKQLTQNPKGYRSHVISEVSLVVENRQAGDDQSEAGQRGVSMREQLGATRLLGRHRG